MHVSHPLQSQAWGQFRSVMGIDVVRLWRLRPELVEGQLTFHKIPFTPFTIGYFPKGPLPTKSMIDELIAIGKQKKSIFIQMEPNIIGNWKLSREAGSRFAGEIGNCDLRPSHHPLFTKYTFVLNLSKSEEDLLKSMHPKTRYNLKVAQKHAVVVKEDNSPEAFEEYLKLSRETTTRQGFYAHNETYHRRMWEILHPAKIAHLWTATYKGKVLAAWIIFIWDNIMYYPYGSSSRENRDVMAPTLLLWEIAKWGKGQGLSSFDLWGALGPHPNEHDPWYGFHRFKQGFNPQLVEFIGSYDLIIHPWLYRLYTIADIIRWKLLK